MTIRLTKWNGLCLTAENKNRRCLKIWWLGKWWGRCGFSAHGRAFFHAEVSHYHHGWTRTRRTWIGPVMIEHTKSLTWAEKHSLPND